MDRISKWKIVSYICILLIICLFSFLTAKYIVRRNIPKNEIPVDTSKRID